MQNPDISKIFGFVEPQSIADLKQQAEYCNALLHTGEGKGNDYLGWVNLPSSTTPAFLADIKACAEGLRSKAQVVIVIGIGGSYLGVKAILEALGNPFTALQRDRKDPYIVFAGHTISEDYMYELMEAVRDYSIATIVISKSGTTTEPAIAFRIVKQEIEKRYGTAEAASRIVAITDASRGSLKAVADEAGYKSYVIPDNVGGRFSVLTPVGLLPLAVAGIDIEALVAGAERMEAATAPTVPFDLNPADIYAAARYALYTKGYKIEILAAYEPRLQYLAEWWKQLFGESEGKEGKGIFPAGVIFSTDLHSMGQYIQEGERILFETVISVVNSNHTMTIEEAENNGDGLNFLAGKRISEVNRMAELGTMLAHVDGGVPNIRIELARIDEGTLGELLYFFEKACGISGYLLGVNPFDQPGVEAYKKNMFALLEKPGYETATAEIQKRIMNYEL
jgi:glucose-6-phosphate isomerase